jgi:uncharacterized protein YjbI with pentapeptide repeats
MAIGTEEPRANLSNANLSCVRGNLGVSQGLLDLQSGNISCSNPSYADLSDATLRGADPPGADLCGADLAGADLTGADLEGARYNPRVLPGACKWYVCDRPGDAVAEHIPPEEARGNSCYRR